MVRQSVGTDAIWEFIGLGEDKDLSLLTGFLPGGSVKAALAASIIIKIWGLYFELLKWFSFRLVVYCKFPWILL